MAVAYRSGARVARVSVAWPALTVTLGSMIANSAAYVLSVCAGRWLGPAGYGEFASLIAVHTVLGVPGLALQAVVAREVVRGGQVARMRRWAWTTAGGTALVAAAVVPIVVRLLHTGFAAAAAAVCAAPALVLLGAEQGLLQGRGRFRTFAWVVGVAGVGRVGPAAAVLACDGSVAAALLAAAVGATAVFVVASALERADRRVDAAVLQRADAAVLQRADAAVLQRADAAPADVADSLSGGRWRAVGMVLRAGQVQAVMMGMASADVLVGRGVLASGEAGLYALGAVVTKAALWAPQAVGAVLYPRLAEQDPHVRRAAVRMTAVVLATLGIGSVAVAAAAAPVVPWIVGSAYREVVPMVWLFAVEGAALAVLAGSLSAAVAGDRTRTALVAWIGLIVEVPAMLCWGADAHRLVAVAACVAAVSAACVTAVEIRSGYLRSRAARTVATVPASSRITPAMPDTSGRTRP